MRTCTRTLLIAVLLLAPSSALLAQTAIDPSGHWTGAVHVPAFDQNPAREVSIEVDLAKNGSGALAGTFSQPATGAKGLPLSTVAVDGDSIAFAITASDGGLFRGTLSDATTMSGKFVTTQGGHAIPFSLTRTGDARIAPTPHSAPIGKELEGTWNGTLEVGGKSLRLVLKMANHADGSATGTMLSVDNGGLEIPIALTQTSAHLTVDVAAVGGSYVGVLNADATLVGTWTQGPVSLPLTFTRAAK
jgi:hypothetical protein